MTAISAKYNQVLLCFLFAGLLSLVNTFANISKGKVKVQEGGVRQIQKVYIPLMFQEDLLYCQHNNIVLDRVRSEGKLTPPTYSDQTLEVTLGLPTDSPDFETYSNIITKYLPIEFNRSTGWNGNTLIEALQFCGKLSGYEICPYEAICPIGEKSMPVTGYKKYNDSKVSWTAIVNGGWIDLVQLSSQNSCVTYMNQYERQIPLEMTKTFNGEMAHQVLCCLNQKKQTNKVIIEEENRQYSITNFTFSNFHNRRCANLDEALAAIKSGRRRWVNLTHEFLPPLQAEKHPSYFVPSNCDLPFMSAHRMCDTLNRYSDIIINGDSMSRHLMQGIIMMLKKDLILGGIESTNKFGKNNPYQCRCDGQFSEHRMCRQNNNFFESFTPRDLELCSNLPEGSQFRIRYTSNNNPVHVDCSSPDYKGAIFVIQGGPHYKTNASAFLHNWVDPLFQSPVFRECQKLNQLKVVWLSYGSQSRKNDAVWKHQAREKAAIFNHEMEQGLKRRMSDIIIVDWLTQTAEAQTSDGFHFLSAVNVEKTNLLMNIISYLGNRTL